MGKIHEGHQGITKCRERAKQSVWWPGLSKQIEDLVEKCDKCSKERQNRFEPMIPSDVPERPWQTVGSDLFELNGSNYLLVVGYLSAFVKSPNWTTLLQPRSWTIWNPYLHGMEFQKLSSPTMIRSTRHRRSVRLLMLVDSLTEQAVQYTHNQTEFPRELSRQSRVSWRRATTRMKHFSHTGQLPWATATVQLSYWWGGSFEQPFRLYHHRWIHSDSGHISKMQGRHSVKISSVKRKRLINVTEWSTWDIWNHVNTSWWKTWIVVHSEYAYAGAATIYVVKTQHGDVRRNRRHLNPTPVAPTNDALSVDVDTVIDMKVNIPDGSCASNPNIIDCSWTL